MTTPPSGCRMGEREAAQRLLFRPTMCRNCGCLSSGHADFDDRPCLLHEDCHAYEPLGRKMANKLNAVDRKEPSR